MDSKELSAVGFFFLLFTLYVGHKKVENVLSLLFECIKLLFSTFNNLLRFMCVMQAMSAISSLLSSITVCSAFCSVIVLL